MRQLVLLFAVQLLGSCACMATGLPAPRLCMAMGFLVGLALAVVLALPILLLGQFTVPVMTAVLAGTMILLVWAAAARGRLTARSALVTVIWAVAFTAACVPFAVHDFSIMTYDSHVFVDSAARLRDAHALTFDMVDFHSRGIFQIVAHALSLFTGDPFLTALAPAFALSLFSTFAIALDRGLRDKVPPRTRWIAIAVVLLAMLAMQLVRVHVVYIHTHAASAGYWFVFAVLLWFAELEEDGTYLPVAFLALLAFSLNRVENPMFAAVFLALAVAATRLGRMMTWSVVAFTLVLVGWLGLLAAVVPEDAVHLTPGKVMLMIAALIAIAAGCVVREARVARRLLPYALPAIAIAIGLGVLAVVAIRLDAFVVTFGSWLPDLWLRPYWGYFAWPLFTILAVWSFWIEQPPHARVLRYSIALFFALVILVTALAPAGYYFNGRYGSLTRIMLHVVPLLWFYFALVFAPVIASRLRRRV